MAAKAKAWRKRDRGAIEGLPLYLLIIVIITAVSIGIVFGMLSLAKPPQALGSVSISPQFVVLQGPNSDGIWTNDSVSLTVIVTDSSGNRLPGAVVKLAGNGIQTQSGDDPYSVTDKDGKASFKNLKTSVVGSGAGPIIVTVEKSGYGKKVLDVPVVQT